MRPSNRAPDAMRPVSLQRNVARYAEGSCLVKFGETHVLCTASLEDRPPMWLRGQGKGWITAEYSMLPRATHTRTKRETAKPSGRTQEIQRLIGRSLRAVTNLATLGERQITIDCDVIQADGGTRTASITGGCVAVALACETLVKSGKLPKSPVKKLVAAVSVGVSDGVPLLDLNYEEDKGVSVDLNVVLTEDSHFVEVQGAGEESTFTQEEFMAMLDLGKQGVAELIAAQRVVIEQARVNAI